MKPLYTTIATPEPVHALVTLADVREQLRIKPNDTANDPWLSKLIERMSRQAERYCNRVFVPQGYVDNFRGGCTTAQNEPLVLSQAPVDPTTVVVTVDGTVLDPTVDFGVDQFAGLVYRIVEPMQWSSAGAIVVQYTAGYDPVPDDIQQAVLDLCTMGNSGRGRDPMLRAAETPGMGRQEYWVGGMPGGDPLPQDIAGMLNPYRRGIIG
jgi:hypothetical protein